MATVASSPSPLPPTHDEEEITNFVNDQWPTKVVQYFSWSDIEKKLDLSLSRDNALAKHKNEWAQNPFSLARVLHSLDPRTFPSVSQARKACEYGKIVVLRHPNNTRETNAAEEAQKINIKFLQNIHNYMEGAPYNSTDILGHASTTISPHDAIVVQTTLPSSHAHYPTSNIGYIYPPPSFILSSQQHLPRVIYEDDHMAVINKPQNLTTVGQKREDLQSILPFLLHPPPPSSKNNIVKPLQFPRPVHRLDKQTSGLVLVAKTDIAMSQLSHIFRKRLVKKSYVAVVFGTAFLNNTDVVFRNDYSESNGVCNNTVNSHPPTNDDENDQECNNAPSTWNMIDYPIDGKNASTLWRIVRTKSIPASSSTTCPETILSLLALRPSTGRYHQIRRHLAYCLQSPIVGDTKYEKVGGGKELTQPLRLEGKEEGMFLCSNALEFPYPFPISTDKIKLGNCDIVEYKDGDNEFWSDGIGKKLSSGCETSCCLYVSGDDSSSDEMPMMRIVVPLPQKFTTIFS